MAAAHTPDTIVDGLTVMLDEALAVGLPPRAFAALQRRANASCEQTR